MAKDSIVIYKSVADALSELDAETYKKVMIAIFSYAYEGNEPDFASMVERMAWHLIKPQIDACVKRYEAQVANGKKRWKTKNSQNEPKIAKNSQAEPNDNDTDNDNDNVNDNDNDDDDERKKKERKRLEERDRLLEEDDYALRHEDDGKRYFEPVVKLGRKKPSGENLTSTGHEPLTEEQKAYWMKRAVDFRASHKGG